MRVLMIFIDGMGIGADDPDNNPYVTAKTPFLDSLMREHQLLTNSSIRTGANWALFPIKTTLGVPGTPQSATGQTTLLTGVNGAAFLGKHLRGFPNRKLRQLIKAENIYVKLRRRGYAAVTFANVYRPSFFDKYICQEKYHSVTTVAALAAEVRLRTVVDLLAGNGVFQDFTNRIIRKDFGVEVPFYEPELAGSFLGGICNKHDFTLFEYYQTDVAGHKQDYGKIQEILGEMDSFLAGVINSVDLTNTVVMITSDHGNMEDISHYNHTENMVPALLITKNRHALSHGIETLEDITPLVLELMAI
ncbi:MAG: alkaline phosphatase family protein [Clostridia bacterium]|nr:alkaline phosphatase family protein [Clostridia bacterium]